MEIYDHGVAQMDAYGKPSIIVSPDQLVAYRYMAATAWERLRQEGRSNGLVWFDPEYRVVPDVQLTTVAIGVVHDRSYTNSQGWLIENIATVRMQVSVQFPKGAYGFPAVWISDFDAATGPSENDPYYCEAVDWHSPLLKGMRK